MSGRRQRCIVIGQKLSFGDSFMASDLAHTCVRYLFDPCAFDSAIGVVSSCFPSARDHEHFE